MLNRDTLVHVGTFLRRTPRVIPPRIECPQKRPLSILLECDFLPEIETIEFIIHCTGSGEMYECDIITQSKEKICYGFDDDHEFVEEDVSLHIFTIREFVKNFINVENCPNLKNLSFNTNIEDDYLADDFLQWTDLFSGVNYRGINIFFSFRGASYGFNVNSLGPNVARRNNIFISCEECGEYTPYTGSDTWFAYESEPNWFRPKYYTNEDDRGYGFCIRCFAKYCLDKAIDEYKTATIRSIIDTNLLTTKELIEFGLEVNPDRPISDLSLFY